MSSFDRVAKEREGEGGERRGWTEEWRREEERENAFASADERSVFDEAQPFHT